jgi:hypothetical protein
MFDADEESISDMLSEESSYEKSGSERVKQVVRVLMGGKK